MSTAEILSQQEYKYGFVTDSESDVIPRGLTEDTIRLIVAKKNEPRQRALASLPTLTKFFPSNYALAKYPWRVQISSIE